MNIKTLFRRARTRAGTSPQRDWSSQFTPREWADLPVHHPRREDSAI
jgi:hypothetical protein